MSKESVMATNVTINDIVVHRGKLASEAEAQVEKWQKRADHVKALKQAVRDLRRLCVGEDDSTSRKSPFAKLSELLADYKNSGTEQRLECDCQNALRLLNRLLSRFHRSTVNVAVTGVGRCGKSTALKTLLGLAQDDNAVIPSGDGPAVTAGRSEIHCIPEGEREHTEITFHTVDSFLSNIVNPMLDEMGLQEYRCATTDDFADLDIDALSAVLEENREVAERKAREVELSADTGMREAELAVARSHADAYKMHSARIKVMRRIQDSFGCFRGRLGCGIVDVPLNETAQYVSYPGDSKPALCFAVKDCRIYANVPNDEAKRLVLTDLPGLGTTNDIEQKCFMEGLDYSVDAALVVRRPTGLFANGQTKEDISVLDALARVYGNEHLSAFAMLFQNDGNLPTSGADKAFASLSEENAAAAHPLSILRGDATDKGFMQGVLLDKVLNFVKDHVPELDNTLSDETNAVVAKTADKFDSQYGEWQERFRKLRQEFPPISETGEILNEVEKIRLSWTQGLTKLLASFSDRQQVDIVAQQRSEDEDRQSEAITQCVQNAQKDIHAVYSPANEKKVEEVALRIMRDHSAMPFVNEELHVLRIRMSETFAKLEENHARQIADMQLKVAEIITTPFEGMNITDVSLDAVIELFDETGETPEIVEAMKALRSLEIPFYSVIYPDFRREVFDSFESAESRFNAVSTFPESERASITLRMLCDLGENWIYKAETLVRRQSHIRDILGAAVERFTDRLVRNQTTRNELMAFVEQNRSLTTNSSTSGRAAQVRNVIDKITK